MKKLLLILPFLFACATFHPKKDIALEYNSDIRQIVLMVAVNLWESGIYTEEQLNTIGFIQCPIYIDEEATNIICEERENPKAVIRCAGFTSFDKDNKPFIKIAGKNPSRKKVLAHEFLHYFQWRLDNKLDPDHKDTRIFNHNCATMACRVESVETIVDDLLDKENE